MLQFYLSKTLAGDLHNHLAEPQAALPGAMQWYGHRVTVQRRKCVLMMELQSRYCIVFAGLTKPDFENFTELFVERVWREAVSICQLDDDQSARLALLARLVGEQQHYQTGSDRSVQAHLRQAADDLYYIANQAGRLPDSAEEQFGCGVKINQMLRKCKGDKDYFVPLKLFRSFWLSMLEFDQQRQTEKERELPDNVVPFRRR